MDRYYAVIVGGGPAGLSCAIALQKKGISNCVVEKSHYPREKLCGGIVTEKTYRVLADLCDGDVSFFREAFIDESNTVSIWDKNCLRCEVNVNHKLRFVNRAAFDSRLMDYYLSLGGIVYVGEKVVDYDPIAKTVYTEQGEYSCQMLIAADGARSVLRKEAGITLKSIGFCLETSIPRERRSLDHGVQIHFGFLKNGYAWVFPCGDHYKIGFGNKYDQTFDYLTAFRSFLSAIGIDPREVIIKGAFVPYGRCLQQHTADDRVVFVGDAAGMVDPIYGEGLYFALRSGLFLTSDSSRAEREQDLRQIKSGTKLRNVFFHPFIQRQFLQRIPAHNPLVSYYIENQVSLYRYPHGQSWKIFRDYAREK